MLITHRLQLDTPRAGGPWPWAPSTAYIWATGAVIDQVLQGDFIPAVLDLRRPSPAGSGTQAASPCCKRRRISTPLLEEWGGKSRLLPGLCVHPGTFPRRDFSPYALHPAAGGDAFCCGFNFRFGRNGAGGRGFLKSLRGGKGHRNQGCAPR